MPKMGPRHSNPAASPVGNHNFIAANAGKGGGDAGGFGMGALAGSEVEMAYWVPYPPIWVLLLGALITVLCEAVVNVSPQQSRRLSQRFQARFPRLGRFLSKVNSIVDQITGVILRRRGSGEGGRGTSSRSRRYGEDVDATPLLDKGASRDVSNASYLGHSMVGGTVSGGVSPTSPLATSFSSLPLPPVFSPSTAPAGPTSSTLTRRVTSEANQSVGGPTRPMLGSSSSLHPDANVAEDSHPSPGTLLNVLTTIKSPDTYDYRSASDGNVVDSSAVGLGPQFPAVHSGYDLGVSASTLPDGAMIPPHPPADGRAEFRNEAAACGNPSLLGSSIIRDYSNSSMVLGPPMVVVSSPSGAASSLTPTTGTGKQVVVLTENEELINVFLRRSPQVGYFGIVKSVLMLLLLFYWLPVHGGWNRYTVLTVSIFSTGQINHVLMFFFSIMLPPLDIQRQAEIYAFDGIREAWDNFRSQDSWSLLENLGKALVVEDVRTVLLQGMNFMLIGATFVPPLLTHVIPGLVAYFWWFGLFAAGWLLLQRAFYRFISSQSHSVLSCCFFAILVKFAYLFLATLAMQQALVFAVLFLYQGAHAEHPHPGYFEVFSIEWDLRTTMEDQLERLYHNPGHFYYSLSPPTGGAAGAGPATAAAHHPVNLSPASIVSSFLCAVLP